MGKRLLLVGGALLLLAILALLPAGCGGEKSYTAKDGKIEVRTEAGESTIKSGGIEVKYSEDEKKSVSLPENYPAEQFPLYPESFVSSVMSEADSIVVICFSADSWDKVADFYRNLFQEGNVISEYQESNGFTSWGVKGGYTYNFSVGESDELKGYVTTFTLSLIPAEEGMEEFLKQMPGLPGKN